MKELSIPLLTEQDIDCRVQSVSKAKTGRVGAVLLLYKDARVDMRILDQVFGPGNWQRTHEVINGNLFCNIDIWDDEKKTWVRKQDVGTESNTEKEKGQASDAFKRAGFNVGIGRELYTGPFIYVELADNEVQLIAHLHQIGGDVHPLAVHKDLAAHDDRLGPLAALLKAPLRQQDVQPFFFTHVRASCTARAMPAASMPA